jgi:hypothetical protein
MINALFSFIERTGDGLRTINCIGLKGDEAEGRVSLTSMRHKLRAETVKSAPDGVRKLIFEPEVRCLLGEDSKISFLA